MVASMAEEAVNPAKDLPIGILGSVGVSTLIYVAMSSVLVGERTLLRAECMHAV
jgi:APA family basic amino acid/polyamine antiporter